MESLGKMALRGLLRRVHEARAAGLTPTYSGANTNDEPDCVHCGGVKFFLDAISGVVPCGHCNKSVGSGIESIGGLSQSLIARSTFDRFAPANDNELEAVLDAADYARKPEGAMVIYGGNGQARMHLGLAILVSAEVETKAWLGSVLYVAHRNRGISDRRQDSSVLERLLAARLLVFDGLGQERRSDHHQGLLSELVYQRYVQGLATVYTTHLWVEDPMVPDQLRYDDVRWVDLDPPADPVPGGVDSTQEAG